MVYVLFALIILLLFLIYGKICIVENKIKRSVKKAFQQAIEDEYSEQEQEETEDIIMN
jgi:hypothetical protein